MMYLIVTQEASEIYASIPVSRTHETYGLERLRVVKLAHFIDEMASQYLGSAPSFERENCNHHRPGPLTAEPSALLPGTYTGPYPS